MEARPLHWSCVQVDPFGFVIIWKEMSEKHHIWCPKQEAEASSPAATETHRLLTAEKEELQNRLSDLLQQKSQMDQLLGDLQSMKGHTRQVLNNGK